MGDIEVGADGTILIYGLNSSESLDGDAFADLLYGNDGDDTITAGAGNDFIIGGLGADSLTAGEGDNVVLGDHGEVTYTTAGEYDLARTLEATAGAVDTITAGAGTLTGMTVSLNNRPDGALESLSFTQGTTPITGSYDSGTGLWTVGTLANAANATLTVDLESQTIKGPDGGTLHWQGQPLGRAQLGRIGLLLEGRGDDFRRRTHAC